MAPHWSDDDPPSATSHPSLAEAPQLQPPRRGLVNNRFPQSPPSPPPNTLPDPRRTKLRIIRSPTLQAAHLALLPPGGSHLASPSHEPTSPLPQMTRDDAMVRLADDNNRGSDGLSTVGRQTQILPLSALASAAEERTTTDPDTAAASRKRMADGLVKSPRSSSSPSKGHARTTSSISLASTTGSNIGELSAELKTRLSYAMVKLHHGWQSRSLDEVESLASRAASPSSNTSTAGLRHRSSASPRIPIASGSGSIQSALTSAVNRFPSPSPPSASPSGGPLLAPPASIRPSVTAPSSVSNPRRNSISRNTPQLLSHSHSLSHSPSPRTPGQSSHPSSARILSGFQADLSLHSPQQHVREQDAIETLLFMSSPGNSANMKHTQTPSASTAAPPAVPRGSGPRHALPSGPRKALPSHRPNSFSNKKATSDRYPKMPPPPDTLMGVDSPHPRYLDSPHDGSTKPHYHQTTTHHSRAALSLPTGLGLSNLTARKTLRDEDIERMLDRAGAEIADSSDDDEIQLPRSRGQMAGIMGA